MSRAVAVVAAFLLLCMGTAHADTVGRNVAQLHSSRSSYKVRLAAALALSKSKDPRAIIALADAVLNDKDATVRRVSALALERMIDARTADDAKELGIDALNQASTLDKDPKVRSTATAALRSVAQYRRKKSKNVASAAKPTSVFVNVDRTVDQSKKLSKQANETVHKIVKSKVESTGYSTSWPGGLPTSKDLSSKRAAGWIVASTVKKVVVAKNGSQAQISCTVEVRVAPWEGKDRGERWEANKAASASGGARTTTSTRDKDIEGGVRECVEAVAESVSSRQVVPFLKRVALAP